MPFFKIGNNLYSTEGLINVCLKKLETDKDSIIPSISYIELRYIGTNSQEEAACDNAEKVFENLIKFLNIQDMEK